MIDSNSDVVGNIIEDYTLRLMEFYNSMCEFPFVINYNEDLIFYKVIPIIEYLEQIVEGLINFNFNVSDDENDCNMSIGDETSDVNYKKINTNDARLINMVKTNSLSPEKF